MPLCPGVELLFFLVVGEEDYPVYIPVAVMLRHQEAVRRDIVHSFPIPFHHHTAQHDLISDNLLRVFQEITINRFLDPGCCISSSIFCLYLNVNVLRNQFSQFPGNGV